MMNNAFQTRLLRRTFLERTGLNLGGAALGTLLASQQTSAAEKLIQERMVAARAKRVIFLCMAGGPSHLETFDYKPELDRMDGQPMPESFTAGQPIAQLQGQQLKVRGHLKPFRQHGQSGQWINDYLHWQAKLADEICIVKSMVTEQINHDPAHTFMNTGTAISGRPSMGAWINYGLGSESQNLPGFVVLASTGGRGPQPIAQRQWGSGFLPSRYQGVEFNSAGEPVYFINNPAGINAKLQRSAIDSVKELNALRSKQTWHDPEIDTRIAAYELAYRMQTSVPELVDFSDESKDTLEMYGATPGDGSFGSNCLLARRMAERGVRFIHLYHRGWDHHGGLDKYMKICCEHTDRATWALVTDLKRRGMLDDTLVIWSGEFGRTPMAQDKGGAGRDHHIKGFSLWMAGGGVKGGMSYGETDDLGYNAVKDVMHVRDLHATMLHLLGLDHERLTHKFQGLDAKLTGVKPARVAKEIFA